MLNSVGPVQKIANITGDDVNRNRSGDGTAMYPRNFLKFVEILKVYSISNSKFLFTR